jgi:hypothetical protein
MTASGRSSLNGSPIDVGATARFDLREIFAYIAEDDPAAAGKFREEKDGED